MSDERPVLTVLVVRIAGTPDDPPERQLRGASWSVIDLLAVPDYVRLGYRVVALDPAAEAAWRVWRAKHPEAA